MLITNRKVVLPSEKTIVIRSAVAKDASSLCEHRRITSGETHFMARYPEECNFDIEKMKNNLTEIENSSQDFMVTAFINDQVIGDLGVTQIRNNLKYLHRAYMGISIQERYCNAGLGSLMVEIAVEQARKNGFEQIELGAFSDNTRAIHLYEKFGFKQYGIQPRAFKLQDGTYRDEIIMVNIFDEADVTERL